MKMNINAITTILQELLYQSNSRTSPTARAESVTQVGDVTVATQKMAEAAATSSLIGEHGRVSTNQTSEQHFPIPAFVPLPLRSELFPEARYFARMDKNKTTAKAEKDVIEEIFICLATEKLGQIWFGLACRKDFLSVTCFTEQEAANKIIRKNFSPLRDELKEIGFKEVSLTSRIKTELGAIAEGQLPKFEAHFLNRTV